MLRGKYLLLLSVTLLGTLAFALSSCGGGGKGGAETLQPPFISAELISFPAGSVPPGFTSNASVVVQDDSSGASIANATVTMNGAALAYNALNEDYEGNVVVAPGGAVSLSVTTAAGTFKVSTIQFSSYPTASAPASGDTWDSGAANTVTWSGGAPVANAVYALGVLDAADTSGPLIWPVDHFVQEIPIGSNSQAIPAFSITAGNRLLVVGILSSNVPIPNAAAGSALVVGGFNYVPITVTGLPVTSRKSGTTSGLLAVAWSGTQFVGVGGAVAFNGTVGSAIVTSPDGIAWTPRNSGASAVLNAVASSGSQIAAVGDSMTVVGAAPILTSVDGISWTPRSSGTTGALTGVAWSGTQFVAVGSVPSVRDTILTSPDGIAWTPRAPGTSTSNLISAVAWSGTQFVVVGHNGLILTSPDGATWTPQTSGFPDAALTGVTRSAAQFVAVGVNFVPCCSDVILTSPDGVTWTPRSSGTFASLIAVASSGTQFMAVGGHSATGGTILTSPDGATWTRRASGTGEILYGVASSGASFVAVGSNGTVLTSP